MPDKDRSSNAWEENALQALYYAFGESDKEGQKLFLNMVFQYFYDRPSFPFKIFHRVREIQTEGLFEVSEETLRWVSFLEGYEYDNREKIPIQIKKLKKLAEKEILEVLNQGALFFQIGCMESALKHHEEACQYYQHAAELHPSFAWTYNNWGNDLAILKRHEEAIEKFQMALQLDPNHAKAYNNWGNCLAILGRYNEAIKKYQMAIQHDPNYAGAYNGWGHCLGNLRQHEEAIKKFQMALQRDPNHAKAYGNWGISLVNLGKNEEATEKFQQAIQRNPNYVNAYNGWGLSLANLGRHQEAIEKYQQALKLDPDNLYAKEHLKRK